MKKKNMYKYFFRIFPVAGKKGERIMKKKKMLLCRIGWATAQLYGKREGFCVAIQSLYCRDLG